MKQILIVEDDELLNKMLVYNLQSESYGIVSVETVKEAMEVLKSQPFDLVLLDINLPDGNGYEIAKTIRDKYSDTIVIFLTANDRESDEIRGYELGAVDYITKPFSMSVLIRKIAAILRRSSQQEDMPHTISYRDLILDLDGYKVYTTAGPIDLTPREFEILRELLTHKGRILTRQNLLQTLWKYEFFGDERIIDTHIKNLRKKLGQADYIETIRGVGYRIDKED